MLKDLLSLFYPRTCIACKNGLLKHESSICSNCYIKLPRSNFHLDKQNPVAKLFHYRVDLEMAASYYLFNKDGAVQEILHHIKYKDKPEIAFMIGQWFGDDLKNTIGFSEADLIIPVPLHKRRLKKRGYNQSAFFGRGLSKRMKIDLREDILYRKAETDTQTRKNRFDRWQNVEDKFGITNGNDLIGKHVILVDDVVTTGATIEACVLELKKTAYVRVSVLAIAYARQ